MKLNLQCIPCFFKQANRAADMLGADDSRRIELMKVVAKVLSEKLDGSLSPAEIATPVHAAVNRFFGVKDPFAAVKKQSNAKMMEMYKPFGRMVRDSADPLKTAVTLSIVGNLIDYSLFTDVSYDEILEMVNKFEPAVFDYDSLKNKVQSAGRILFITDNAGEVVLDRILVDHLFRMGKKVIVAAKESPILNDATLEDLESLSFGKISKVIAVGDSEVGTLYPSKNEMFNKIFKTSDLIISKGQANYETLSGVSAPIYFLFVVKCCAVGAFLKAADRSPMLMQGK